ncbi:MAG: TetR/AcrR family transcriptional regulator [Cyanobacteria bacterium QS_7_48_42]|jgi:AcrR family transcriptional regulator|nr:MAG: TetR/AcrR family transcriptional regulator [Cyanobacteria bacterium QH_1_48_107]PSO54058.1 MAG: TetR/AcrR family transcriptional regulator [Cyanobacteria bacterium QH_10_48_56]PSO56532.1 MAG: TetR/AcrR family transcriptional regulator [Cyanobacteria bacterium QH_7_48_89]PSO59855.1 MAG: TetR/AcrR family transcriptional regulator [Cyanobacteria bacterium QH_2_48_84]PSO74829.1 MAG: TetR/AcrR family transcriptional regulator [Cyanobacteria bacterium QS_1_48_34]PSO75155.1 MAG: TetR/AcrR fam
MPTQTFFNLPEEKRRMIVEIAIAEFANHDYANASISRIVAQAKIAKGSFYQYFQDKKDLCLYLVKLASEEKIAFLRSNNPPELQQGFFPYLRWLMGAGARFDLTHPALSQVVYRAIYGELPFREEAHQQTKEISLEYVQQLVEQGIAQGDIDTDVDPDLAAFVINTLGNELGKFILSRRGISPKQLAQEGPIDLDMQRMENIFDEVIQILERGMNSSKN